MTFHTGQKVICVARAHGPLILGRAEAHVGKTYTIRNLQPIRNGCWTCGNDLGLHFDEIVNPEFETFAGLREISFCSKRFRPVVEHETDISDLKRLLLQPQADRVTA